MPRAAVDVSRLTGAVLRWYAAEGRDLPWRRTRDPYPILVSEVMLQQTQVARVLGRYERWLERWPTVRALARAGRDEVIAEWVGLGHNLRALRLREAAIAIARDGWPRDAAGLRALPGVGPYTAAAVACIAFGEPVAAVDTNVRRVAARIGVTPADLLPSGRAQEWNQAAMELGATVCTARVARCEVCPAAPWCPSAGMDVDPPSRGGARRSPRFEDSDRWARGRVVAALAGGEALPADLEGERLERVLRGLERDGLVQRGAAGAQLPTDHR